MDRAEILLQRILDELQELADRTCPPAPDERWCRGLHAAQLIVEAVGEDLGVGLRIASAA